MNASSKFTMQQSIPPSNYNSKKRSSISFGSYRTGNTIQGSSNDGLNTNFVDRNAFYSNSNAQGGVNEGLSNIYSSLSLMAPPNIQQQQQQQQQREMSFNDTQLCSYRSKYPFYGLDWSSNNEYGDLVCLGSYKEDNSNTLQILQNTNLTGGFPEWTKLCQQQTLFPVSKIQWDPSLESMSKINNGLQTANIATCSDSLRIWSLKNMENSNSNGNNNSSMHDNNNNNNYINKSRKNGVAGGNNSGYVLEETMNLSLWKYYNKQGMTGMAPVGGAAKTLGSLPPVTSCDWNKKDPSIIISSSIDTTCTVWDLNRANVRTQLIAHDSEVFDVKFLTNSTHLFATCGNDGSARVFDLRSLEHSSIIYEPLDVCSPIRTSSTASLSSLENPIDIPMDINNNNNRSNALLRLETCPFDINIVATFANQSNSVMILDMRYPGQPVTILQGHTASVNSIKWHPSKKGILASSSDDCQVLVWDVNMKAINSPEINANNFPTSPLSKQSTSTDNTNDLVNADCYDKDSLVNENNGSSEDNSVSTSNSTITNNKINYPNPILCYNDYVNEEINNITWRGGQGNGDWLGFVRGKSFQTVKC